MTGQNLQSRKPASRIESVGTFVPQKRLKISDLVENKQSLALKKLQLLTGIHQKAVCSDGEDTKTLAVKAAMDCLKFSSYRARDLDMIVSCSISRHLDGHVYHCEPPVSLYIKNAIGAVNAVNFDVINACAGMLTGVYIADNFIRRGKIRNCMVVSGEYITTLGNHATGKIRSLANPELASLTVGDAGAAAIVERQSSEANGLFYLDFFTLAQYSHLCTARQKRSFPYPIMKTRARKLHRVSVSDSKNIVQKALENSGLTMDQIDYMIPHQTSKSAIKAGLKQYENFFKAKPGNTIINLKNFGNTASTSHFLALYCCLQKRKFKPGDRILLLALASGLVVGVILLTMDDLVERYG
ncbi:3-oxoacyl-ACP synthase [candidate division KSB1 bacterium]|nr:3-oxoacyl-ACP synthase [candidate division KSB1 bacterium]